ncbi:DUF6731 family protein [Lactiplantibacillus pentosus]|uniref:Uncharacterized protein n=1 Tax=Lactiplantibacillus pentosus TaxID=1589 RepID=A0AAW8VZ56_LACPE|nr:DUF6731 family protein [Lactiplantibacillus pentosus]MBU7473347.1 hypothetical protein [Lactiplantibacillus pentosus]MBU7528606.1 hypothetical protein [Lactiplantibacillus pentosus]MCA1342450.1 hypothetical protein [Lactiplantibacillus pentosus]MCJ8185816.1 hypothetical protein [Lactiplantibacillus pentosus]MDT6990751.1 hypothetical protein [Lactiplantibacillus pentosus]
MKNVKFDYFQVQISNRKSVKATKARTRMFDLTQWMDIIRPKYENEPASVTLNFFGEQIRCDHSGMVGVGTKKPLARLHFTKLREKNSPAVGSIHDVKLDPVNLKPDEYIAEDVTALFDPEDSVLMLQKNIYSLSRGVLEAYITELWNSDKEKKDFEYVHLVPIFQKNNFSKGKRANKIESIAFKTANRTSKASFVNPFKGQIGAMFDTMKPLDGVNIEVRITASRTHDSFLKQDGVVEMIDEIQERKNLFKKAEISFRDGTRINEGATEATGGDNAELTYIDLMHGKVQSVLPFNIPKKRPLNQDAVWTSMMAEYREDGGNMVNEVKACLTKVPAN